MLTAAVRTGPKGAAGRQAEKDMSKTFLVGIDGSEEATRAARHAAGLAKDLGARLILLHVIDWSGFEHLDVESLAERHRDKEREVKKATAEILEPAAAALGGGLDLELKVMHGHVAEQMAWLAREREVDGVFVGRRGRGRFASLVLGSVSLSLVQACDRPLTVVP